MKWPHRQAQLQGEPQLQLVGKWAHSLVLFLLISKSFNFQKMLMD